MFEIINSPSNNLNFEDHLTLEKIMRRVLPTYQSNCNRIGFNNYACTHISINERMGHSSFSMCDLLFYPVLNQYLRQIKPYPFYSVTLAVKDIKEYQGSGLKSTIKALCKLDAALETYRDEKSILDVKANNLVKLYGQEKCNPIYNRAKPYYTNHQYSRYNKKPFYYLVFISWTRYFNQRVKSEIYKNKVLYELLPGDILKDHIKRYYNYDKPVNVDSIKNLVSGIINTPILIFRCAKSYSHKGKLYYFNFHTNKLMSTLSQARITAESYAGENYKIDILETDA